MKKKLTYRIYILLLSLYITQYIGLAFFAEAFIGILRKNGMPLENLGIVYMLGLFWVFRFLWAPFIDKIELGRIGHYKGWILLLQSLMGFILFIASYFSIQTNLQTIIILSILFAFFSSSQTIALDGLVYKNVFKKEHSSAMAIKMASGLIGMVLGGGLGLVLYTYFGWKVTMNLLSFSMFIAFIQIIFYKESKAKKLKSTQKLDYSQFISFWKGKKKKQWLLLLFLFPASISSAHGLISPMLIDMGWTLDKIGYFVHIVGYSIGICASLSSSWFIQKYGKRKVLIVSSFGQVLGLLMLLVLFQTNNTIVIILLIGFIFPFYTPAAVTMSTIMMNKSSKVAPATQFAMQHSVFNFAAIFFSSISISMSGVFGYSNIIMVGSVVGLISMYITFQIKEESMFQAFSQVEESASVNRTSVQ